MVRLMLTLTPAVCVLSGIAFSHVFSLYLREDEGGVGGDNSDEDSKKPAAPVQLDRVSLF
jgi:hypothetical protein